MKYTRIYPPTNRPRWRAVQGMLLLLNRRHYLEGLADWAEGKYMSRKGKKFYFIHKSYVKQIDMAQQKLFLLRMKFPHLFWIARILHAVSNVLSVKPAFNGNAIAHPD